MHTFLSGEPQGRDDLGDKSVWEDDIKTTLRRWTYMVHNRDRVRGRSSVKTVMNTH
jgi:hypothetical protein